MSKPVTTAAIGVTRVKHDAGAEARAEDLRRFISTRPAWAHILEEATWRYHDYNGLAGEIRLETVDLREAALAIGCRLNGRQQHRLKVAELDRAFREETRFGLGLVEVLAIHAGRPVLTKQEEEALRESSWEAFCQHVLEATPDAGRDRVTSWLDADDSYLRSQINAKAKNEQQVITTAHAIAVIERLSEPIMLPVLAQRACGNPHGLDDDAPAGRYLTRALALTSPDVGITLPLEDARERELLLASANVSVDDVSSNVHVYHLLGEDPLVAGAREAGHIITLPLATVSRLAAIGASRGSAHVVENPAVFSTLVARVATWPVERRPTLICTSGQLSLAARRLLELLVSGGATLYYGGDFDHMGLTIARSLQVRWPGAVTLWRMTEADYDAARSGVQKPVPPERLLPLQDCFPGIIEGLVRNGPAYQEALVDVLCEDLTARHSAVDATRSTDL